MNFNLGSQILFTENTFNSDLFSGMSIFYFISIILLLVLVFFYHKKKSK